MRKRMSGSVLLLVTLAFSLIGGDFLVLAAQDPPNPAPANPTQTPQTPAPQTEPTQPQTTKKRTSKKKRGEMTTTTATGDQTTTPADATTPAQTEPAQMPAQATAPAQPRANMASEQTDLSGTYAGTFNCDALGLTGDTTLTVTGNQFTTADGKTGRIVASTTGGYTAVALQTGDVPTGANATTAAPGATATAPTIVSLRARKRGNSLTLTSAPGSTMQCSFAPTRNVARTRRSRQRTPAATGSEVSNPATMPSPTSPTQPTPEQPTPQPSQTPEPSPSPSPNPSPTPSGSPTPMPSPTPSGSPTPEPAPTATPSPTASPSPSPSPARPRG